MARKVDDLTSLEEFLAEEGVTDEVTARAERRVAEMERDPGFRRDDDRRVR